jgi:hypothetical protein
MCTKYEFYKSSLNARCYIMLVVVCSKCERSIKSFKDKSGGSTSFDCVMFDQSKYQRRSDGKVKTYLYALLLHLRKIHSILELHKSFWCTMERQYGMLLVYFRGNQNQN